MDGYPKEHCAATVQWTSGLVHSGGKCPFMETLISLSGVRSPFLIPIWSNPASPEKMPCLAHIGLRYHFFVQNNYLSSWNKKRVFLFTIQFNYHSKIMKNMACSAKSEEYSAKWNCAYRKERSWAAQGYGCLSWFKPCIMIPSFMYLVKLM